MKTRIAIWLMAVCVSLTVGGFAPVCSQESEETDLPDKPKLGRLFLDLGTNRTVEQKWGDASVAKQLYQALTKRGWQIVFSADDVDAILKIRWTRVEDGAEYSLFGLGGEVEKGYDLAAKFELYSGSDVTYGTLISRFTVIIDELEPYQGQLKDRMLWLWKEEFKSRGGVSAIVDRLDRAPLIENAKRRTWVSADGKFRTDARLIKYVGAEATLRKNDGTTVVVPLDKLSADDQDFLRERRWLKAGIKP